MSVTGPGCTACDFRGRVPFHPEHPLTQRPCVVCSSWTCAPDWPPPVLRALAAAILGGMPASETMRAWAADVAEFIAETEGPT